MKPLVLVAGAGPLGRAILEHLAAAGAEIRAIGSAADADELRELDVPFTTGSAPSAGTLTAAGIASASALVLAADDDAGNVDAALTARRLRSDLPLVVRLFDPALGTYLRDTLDRVEVLSMSAVGAPVFADLALRALAERASRGPVAAPPPRPRRRRHVELDRVAAGVLAGFVALVALATAYFTVELRLRPLDALYFVWTTVMTVGYGDIALRDASDTAKIAGMIVMFAGAAFIAALFAFFTGAVVARRLDAVRGRVPERGHGHLVVAGAGNVGFRVAQLLAEHGHRVVVVERDGEARNVGALRAEGHHVIVADASVEETLDLARVEAAGAVLAVTDSDAVNLQVALAVRRRNPEVPVVARLASPELSAHVAGRADARTASSVAIAGEAFARAALRLAGEG